PNGTHLVDTLLKKGVNITALFAPEHGIRGDHAAGAKVEHQTDPKTGLPIYSLYGGTRKPAPEMLNLVDVVIFDMQDVGARFYTFGSTMAYVMEAAAENAKQIIVLDRPNPINGIDIEGPLLDTTLKSFLGLFPIPIRHGLTLGEMAKMIVGEGYINPSNVELVVIPMEGWKRSMWYDETGLPWISPSPNMKTLATATVYPGTCLFEATNISEGRGTPKPFEYIGAPMVVHNPLVTKLNSLRLPGVQFKPMEFTPKADSVSAPNPKFNNKLCRGVFVVVTDRTTFKPVLTGLMMMASMKQMYQKKFQIKDGLLNRLSGDESISELLEKKKLDINVLDRFKNDLTHYQQLRSKYLLYD
ncbi:MAG TPA: DUF1343 domain-containing protein, partial [Bacteroidota bacterium]|nr:DUF1343 domain-containing protein [Bacteroidota bacterium]